MFELIDHPVPVKAGAYEQALDEAVRLLKGENGVVSVCPWGTGHCTWSTGEITEEIVNEYIEHHRSERPNRL